MVLWCNRVTMSDAVAQMTLNPARLNENVVFTFINVRTGKEISKVFPLQDAILLAESRREDKRYKNYEFHISV